MGPHDWSHMPDGLFHGFHTRWLSHLAEALNTGVLPDGYSAEAELHFGRNEADVLTLRDDSRPGRPDIGGVAVAAPRVRRQKQLTITPSRRPRTLAVRRDSGTLVAIVEIVSPSNKDRDRHAAEFVEKVCRALRNGVHVTVLDIHPPTRSTPGGWHPAVEAELAVLQDDPRDTSDDQPADAPVSLLSYEADGPRVGAYLEYLPFGGPMPDMPLFLAPGRYVGLPLEATYGTTLRGTSKVFRDMLPGEGTAG